MSEKTVHIPDISCGHCLATVKREISEMDGVTSVEGDVDSKNVSISWQAPADWERIEAMLTEIGYPAK